MLKSDLRTLEQRVKKLEDEAMTTYQHCELCAADYQGQIETLEFVLYWWAILYGMLDWQNAALLSNIDSQFVAKACQDERALTLREVGDALEIKEWLGVNLTPAQRLTVINYIRSGEILQRGKMPEGRHEP